MKRLITLSLLIIALGGCAPVLHRETMKAGILNAPLAQLRQNPDAFKGKVYILGGLIVETKFMEKGSQIEALSVHVDSYGYLMDEGHTGGRFLAVYPRDKGLLDPLVFKKSREITLAGEFIETRTGKIDEMEYVYPVFEIKEIYLWDERKEYYLYPSTPYYYPYPYGWYYDPWWKRYPYGPPPAW